ncbi:MAG: STAS domain-containing protein [Chitinivibrionales bacterium]|nr:STAS domain-containing protein [Chitinivibrionales bacterium]
MRIRKVRSDRHLTVAVDGVLRATPESIAFFQELCDEVLDDISELHLELSGVLFTDSLWLGFLVTLSLQCKERGIRLEIPTMSRQLHRLIRAARLDRALPQPLEVSPPRPTHVLQTAH